MHHGICGSTKKASKMAKHFHANDHVRNYKDGKDRRKKRLFSDEDWQ